MKYPFLAGALIAIWSLSASATPTLDPDFCKAITQHTPSQDLHYQEGIDSHGNKVAPADSPSSANIKLPKKLRIPLNADLMAFLNIETSTFPFNALAQNDIKLGELTIEEGKVFYQGQPLSDPQQENLAVLCLKETK